MKPTQDNYPIFEANQVLSYSHLNQVFNYLDEQERLTRADLIGIGIACGLGLRFDPNEAPTAVHLGKGCGVTSQGYLVVEPDDVSLVSYRQYLLPTDLDYQPFKDGLGVQYPLWEMFPAGEPNTTGLATPNNFLSDKAVVLFLELKKEGLRNCSPNNCDDKGSAITAVVRRLLIVRSDLDKIIAAANQLGADLSSTSLAEALSAELGLEDIRLPRYDVPNSNPATSQQLLAAFFAVFQAGKLAGKTASVLSATYQAFKPILSDLYPADPFLNTFAAKFGFLDTAPQTPTQVLFLQYYYDFFDDLLKAYDELRRKGVGLMCACCPPDGLFPRHLMLGLAVPDAQAGPGLYRQQFIASGALNSCAETSNEVRELFQRLVQMAASFTDAPSLAQSAVASRTSSDIRITPSRLGSVPPSEKAIPYYYAPDGTPPLYRLWSPEKTRRNRDNLNLGYYADHYQPPAPTFVTSPLLYDLEPYNFLRIEGHLGKNYLTVLQTLLLAKSRYRLPIEIIALRTGAFDENVPVDLSKESCRFQDLEVLYDTLKGELACILCKEVQYLYNQPFESGSNTTTPVKAILPMLVQCAPDFLVQPNTLGRFFEDWLRTLPGQVLTDVNLNFNLAFVGRSNVLVVLIVYISRLFDELVADLGQLNFPEFQKRYQDLVGLTVVIEAERESAAGNIEGNLNLLKWEELDERLNGIIYHCRLEPFKALEDEYLRRIKEVKQKQFLSFYLQQNPGIQHKAGVPQGGTFILVYHSAPAVIQLRSAAGSGSGQTGLTGDSAKAGGIGAGAGAASFAGAGTTLFAALTRLQSKEALLADPDIQVIFGQLTGKVPPRPRPPFPGTGGLDPVFDEAVNGLEDGAVIADFFVPYLCCSDCSPIQFVLPEPPLSLTVQLGCTDANGSAVATLTAKGGVEPYSYQLDNQPFAELAGTLVLSVGTHTLSLRDSAGAQSALQTLTVPGPLTIGAENYLDDASAPQYRVSFAISGGTAPYTADSGAVANGTFTSNPVASGEKISVTINDGVGCTASKEFVHTVCNLPCGGQARRCAYRLWLQPIFDGAAYEIYQQESALTFRFNGEALDMSGTETLLQLSTAELNGTFQDSITGIVKKLNDALNAALAKKFGADQAANRLTVAYQPADTDPFGILWIEHLVCETFAIQFDFSFAKPNPAFSLRVVYGNEPTASGAPFDGFLMINRRLNNKQTSVPAFDCSERNLCSGSDPQKLCPGVDAKPVIAVQPLENNLFSFKGDADPAVQVAAWVWDAPIAQSSEPFYVGQAVSAQLQKPGGTVRLTVITQQGCFNGVEKSIVQ